LIGWSSYSDLSDEVGASSPFKKPPRRGGSPSSFLSSYQSINVRKECILSSSLYYVEEGAEREDPPSPSFLRVSMLVVVPREILVPLPFLFFSLFFFSPGTVAPPPPPPSFSFFFSENLLPEFDINWLLKT